jgi:hypothetical protein
MTKTTAKKGMIEFKTGHAKLDFDYDYLQSINYDDKRKLKEVIETLFNVNKELGKEYNKRFATISEDIIKLANDNKAKPIYELTLDKYGHITGYKKVSRDLLFIGELPIDIDNQCYTVDMVLDEKKIEAMNSLD